MCVCVCVSGGGGGLDYQGNLRRMDETLGFGSRRREGKRMCGRVWCAGVMSAT